MTQKNVSSTHCLKPWVKVNVCEDKIMTSNLDFEVRAKSSHIVQAWQWPSFCWDQSVNKMTHLSKQMFAFLIFWPLYIACYLGYPNYYYREYPQYYPQVWPQYRQIYPRPVQYNPQYPQYYPRQLYPRPYQQYHVPEVGAEQALQSLIRIPDVIYVDKQGQPDMTGAAIEWF